MKHFFDPYCVPTVTTAPPQTVGPCAVQNPTAPETCRGKLGKAHWESELGHNSVFFPYPPTTKMWGSVKERDEMLKNIHMLQCSVPNIHFLYKTYMYGIKFGKLYSLSNFSIFFCDYYMDEEVLRAKSKSKIIKSTYCLVLLLLLLPLQLLSLSLSLLMNIGDSHGRVWPEPMQKKSTKSSLWKSVKIIRIWIAEWKITNMVD